MINLPNNALQLRHAGRVERYGRSVARNAPQRREREGLLSDEQCVHYRIIGRLRPCSFEHLIASS